jgi:predicted nucleic acid-binding protein
MILYLDTSSLVKLYVDEPGSQEVTRLLEKAEIAGASRHGTRTGRIVRPSRKA